MQARLITLEGIDGVGKTTHIAHLVEYLSSQDLPVTTYREPGATPLGEELRQILKHGPPRSPLAELLLFAAARAELVNARVTPDLAAGTWVILDRFTESTLAYQGALGAIPEKVLKAVCKAATAGLVPDLTLWLDLEPQQAFSRRYPLAGVLDAHNGGAQAAMELDAIEQRSLGYFTRVRERYLAMQKAEPDRILRIDASGSVEETAAKIKKAVTKKIKAWSKRD